MLISGASSSVIRASIMTILMILADILYFKSDTISNIAFSAIIILLINPLTIFDIGFILSFGGTLGIVLLSKDFEKLFSKFGKLAETLGVTCSAQMVLMPIMMYYFNTISILSIITNLIVAPLSGTITIMGFITFIASKIFFPLGKLLATSLYMLSYFTIFVSEFFSKISFSTINVITPNFLEILIYYFILFCLVKKEYLSYLGYIVPGFCKYKKEKGYKYILPRQNYYRRWLCIVALMFIILELIYYNFPKNYIDINFVDVGQGDAIYIKTSHNKNILIDGGGSETYDVGENVLKPYLLDKRVTKLDIVFSTHSDADHINGIITVLEDFSVDMVVIAKNALGYEKLYEIANRKKVEIIEVLKNNIIEIDGVLFKVLSPDLRMDSDDINEYSLVLKMEYYEKSILFTGDIGKDTESNLQNVEADLLKVAHHGSNGSSDANFIARVKPKISVIQVAKDNKYGHPSKDVLKSLRKFSKIYTTAEMGEINFRIYKDRIEFMGSQR